MAEALQVDLVSPEKVLFSGEANMVITRTLGGGEIAFQAGHAAFLGALQECHTRVYLENGDVVEIMPAYLDEVGIREILENPGPALAEYLGMGIKCLDLLPGNGRHQPVFNPHQDLRTNVQRGIHK